MNITEQAAAAKSLHIFLRTGKIKRKINSNLYCNSKIYLSFQCFVQIHRSPQIGNLISPQYAVVRVGQFCLKMLNTFFEARIHNKKKKIAKRRKKEKFISLGYFFLSRLFSTSLEFIRHFLYALLFRLSYFPPTILIIQKIESAPFKFNLTMEKRNRERKKG